MAKQITQKQMFKALVSLVESNPDFEVKADGIVANADKVIEFLNSRIEALDKKVSKSNDKVDKEQAEVDEKVLSVMSTEKRKVSEILEIVKNEYPNDEGVQKYTSSKITASLRRLMGNNLVLNVVEKKNSYYFLAE